MPMSSRILGLLLLTVGAGCSHAEVLRPTPGAQLVPGEANTATAQSAGVRLMVNGAWKGDPGDLWQIVTPVLVTVENHSGAPLRIHYEEFQLTTDSGLSAHAMPPFQIQRPGSVTPEYPFTGFFVAPMFSPWFPGIEPWGGPFDYDPFYWNTYDKWPEPLPSRDMLAKALPVGVLQEGGRVKGYVYFQKIPQGTPQVTFTFDAVDATSGNDLGRVTILLTPAS